MPDSESLSLRPSIPTSEGHRGLRARGVADASPSLLGKWGVKRAGGMERLLAQKDVIIRG